MTAHRFTCSADDAKHIRAFLTACGARFAEGRHWLFRRKFTVTADDAVMQVVWEILNDLRVAHSYGSPQRASEQSAVWKPEPISPSTQAQKT